MPTVRPHAGRVAEEFLDDALASGIDHLSLYFSTDPPLGAGEPRIGSGYGVAVHHVGAADRAALGVGELVERPGYASARNAPLLLALRDGHDVAVFVDDDVHPLFRGVRPVPGGPAFPDDVHPSGGFLRSHLDGLAAGADVTRGGYVGHGAPLVDLSQLLGPECRDALGLALSLGNEVLPADCLTAPPVFGTAELPVLCRGLVVYGGNVGISLAALASGRIPPFFCPPGARGEDTFFGLRLAGAAVTGAAPVRHDPFRLGRDAPAAVPPTPAHLRRFAGAVRGWVRYAPLWVRTQHPDPAAVLETIAAIYTGHRGCLETLGLGDVPHEFTRAVAAAESEHALLDAADVAWRAGIVPRFRP